MGYSSLERLGASALVHHLLLLLLIIIIIIHIFKVLLGLGREGRFVDATVKLTNNMNLECVYPKTDGMTQMSWVKSIATGKETIAVSHPLYGVHIEDKYKDRVHFINASSRDKSLNFMKTTEADMGFYICSITFPDGVWEKVVEVIQSDSFEVFVPPTNHTIIEPGGNVTLRCPYSVGGLVQEVMWERIKADRMDTIVLSAPWEFPSVYPLEQGCWNSFYSGGAESH
uniref:Immunoglobulin V-set domain-containing protein n=1 Tax=Terrapene triunguis TaxID=2587831 RepID=A0A674IW94_9SAUR